MDRVQLRNIIGSGRAVAMDLHAISQSIGAGDQPGRLFRLDILNKTILIKQFGTSLPTARRPVFVDTTVYFPYDNKNVFDGGESINYSHHAVGSEILKKITYGAESARFDSDLEHDLEVLDFFHGVHSLDPFLLKSFAIKSSLLDRINEAYFLLPAQEWRLIEEPIREKVFRLVTKAIGVKADAALSDETLQYVARFLRKVWEAKDADGIEPFVEAMQIQPGGAADAFFAWKAVSYYQVRFNMLREQLKDFLAWVGDSERFRPAEFHALSERQRKELMPRINALKQAIRHAYREAERVLDEYETAYHLFISENKPATFKNFLLSSDTHYLILARSVSIFWHGVNVYQDYASRRPGRLPSSAFFELLECLCTLFGVADFEVG